MDLYLGLQSNQGRISLARPEEWICQVAPLNLESATVFDGNHAVLVGLKMLFPAGK